jgi:hypothetical protein
LVVILRNPVERAISAYFHYIGQGFLPLRDVEAGMREILDGKLSEQYPASRDILEYGLYAEHLSRYMRIFDPSRFCILLHDEILKDKLGAVRKVYRFLGVNPDYMPRAISSKPQAVIYNPRRLRIHVRINRLLFKLNGTKTRIHSRKWNPFSIALARLLAIFDNRVLGPALENKKPILSAGLKSRLSAYFAADIGHLERLIDKDLSAWKQPRAALAERRAERRLTVHQET